MKLSHVHISKLIWFKLKFKSNFGWFFIYTLFLEIFFLSYIYTLFQTLWWTTNGDAHIRIDFIVIQYLLIHTSYTVGFKPHSWHVTTLTTQLFSYGGNTHIFYCEWQESWHLDQLYLTNIIYGLVFKCSNIFFYKCFKYIYFLIFQIYYPV